MQMMSLPTPEQDAITHSQQLVNLIRQQIRQQGGAISFHEYMKIVLYQPALGYYVAGASKIGASGDFVTAPEVSPLFSYCLANQVSQVLEHVSAASILELGAGLGTMAADVLSHLQRVGNLPEQYYILDLSPELKQRQYQTLQAKVPDLLNKVVWLDSLPETFDGVILANEVLDAMPVQLFKWHNEQVFERHIGLDDQGKLQVIDHPASDLLESAVNRLALAKMTMPYVSEINSNIKPWLGSIAKTLNKGAILLIDYGYTRQEYYLPERNNGTLICHYRHHVHDDPLFYPGLQDITASVDFTAVAEAADQLGLQVAGYTPQANFLAQSGLESLFIESLQQAPDQQYALAQQIRTLSLPSQMGERFKVMALTKQCNMALMGFSKGDQRFRL